MLCVAEGTVEKHVPASSRSWTFPRPTRTTGGCWRCSPISRHASPNAPVSYQTMAPLFGSQDPLDQGRWMRSITGVRLAVNLGQESGTEIPIWLPP